MIFSRTKYDNVWYHIQIIGVCTEFIFIKSQILLTQNLFWKSRTVDIHVAIDQRALIVYEKPGEIEQTITYETVILVFVSTLKWIFILYRLINGWYNNNPCNSVYTCIPLQWSHNERDGVSNHQPAIAQIKENENSAHKWPVTRKMFPFDDVIMHNCVPPGILVQHHANWLHKKR